MSEVEHDHDDDGNCVVPVYAVPCWRFSLWDIAGIGIATLGGFFTVVGQGSQLLAREFSAAANYARQNADLREAQAQYEYHQQQMAENLRELLEGPTVDAEDPS